MSRTHLFGALRRALQLARFSNTTDVPVDELVERVAAERRARISRRSILAGGAAAAVLAPVAACGGGQRAGKGNGGKARVAVVGAGMAGLHCAWHLAAAGIDVTVYEASNRAGGRMFTARGKLPDNQLCELGGELIDSDHKTIRALAGELGLALDDLLADGPQGDTYHFDGRLVPETEIVEMFARIAAPMEQAAARGEADTSEFGRLDGVNIVQWLTEAGADPLLVELLDVAYTIEYGLQADAQSAWNLLYLIDYVTPDPFRIFGDSDERYHLHDGNDAIPARLAADLDAHIETGAALTALARTGDRYKLSFARGSGGFEHTADHVVLALPFSTLRAVDLRRAGFSADKLEVIADIGYGTNTKVMGSFTRRVWATDHQRSGASYSDAGFQCTWDTSRGQSGASGVLTNFLGGDIGLRADAGTPDERMRAALDGIDAVFPGARDAYAPNSALRMHWASAPWNKGSYTCYRTGQARFSGMEGRREHNVHFCGEHASVDFQGYMEGACETGARAASDVLATIGTASAASLRRILAAGATRPSRMQSSRPTRARVMRG